MGQARTLDPIDARAIQKICRTMAKDPHRLDTPDVVERIAESGSGEVQYEVEIGDWVVVLVLEAGDLAITDIRHR